jgi:hypothetical protein
VLQGRSESRVFFSEVTREDTGEGTVNVGRRKTIGKTFSFSKISRSTLGITEIDKRYFHKWELYKTVRRE